MVILEKNIVAAGHIVIPLILENTRFIKAIISENTERISVTFALFILAFI